GMLRIDGGRNRLLFEGVQGRCSRDWGRRWGDETPDGAGGVVGMQGPGDEMRAAFAGVRE
ncbi:GTP-binding protein, partial [Salmonella enterica]